MTVTLKALDADGGTRAVSGEKAFTLGRGPDNDWILEDPGREISKIHCRIEADATGFVLIDQSINGVTVEGDDGPLGPGRTHRLATGDVFAVGRHRFAVTLSGDGAAGGGAAGAPVPSGIRHILDGGTEGAETRAAGPVSGEADRWLGTLPQGSADEGLREPMGWGEPPRTAESILPDDFDLPASDFGNRSEHTPAVRSALSLPRASQVIPFDWLDRDGAAAATPPRPAAPSPPARPDAVADQADPAEALAWLAKGARLDPRPIETVPVDTLFRRAGEALRALLDGLDALEAAQAVAEHECGLDAVGPGDGRKDFFDDRRDPALLLLLEDHAGPADRLAALANRQRSLGLAVAAAAVRHDAELSPASVAAEAGGGLRVGPFAKAAAWGRFAARHAELTQGGSPSFLATLRKTFGEMTAKRT